MKNINKLMKNAGYIFEVIDIGKSVVNIYRGKESMNQGAKKIVKKGAGFAVKKGVGRVIAGSVLGTTGLAPVVIGFVAVSAVEFAIDRAWKN